MSKLPSKILIIDSDQSVAGPLHEPLSKMKIEVFSASDLQTAMYRFNKQFFKVVFVEMRFPELDGLSLIQKWRDHKVKEKRTAGFVVTTGKPLANDQLSLLNEMGKIAIVQKPLVLGPMISQIQKAFRSHTKQELSIKIQDDILQKLEKSGDFKEAIKRTQECQEVLSELYYPFVLDLYQRAESFEEGLELITKIPQDKIEPLQRLNLLGKFNLKLGNLDKARKFYEEADHVAPKNIDRIIDMVDMYIQMKKPNEAISKQKELLKANPENPDMKYDLFKQLEDGGLAEDAAKFCQDTSGPKEVVRYFNNKGVVMAQTNDLDVAIKEYTRALNYYPKNKNNYLIHFNLALALLKKKDANLYPEAKEQLNFCLELEPEYSKASDLLNKILQKEAS